jgi:hypothetical protein
MKRGCSRTQRSSSPPSSAKAVVFVDTLPKSERQAAETPSCGSALQDHYNRA